MISVAFTLILLIAYPIFAVLVFNRWYKRQKQALLDMARAYFESPAENEPSQFSKFVDIVAQRFASQTVISLKAQLMNMQSLSIRQGNKLVAEKAVEGLPDLVQAIPGIERMIKKNPLLGIIGQFFMSKIVGAAGVSPATVGSPSNGHADVFNI